MPGMLPDLSMGDSMQLAIEFTSDVSVKKKTESKPVKQKTEVKTVFNEKWEREPYKIEYGTNHPLQYHVLSHTNGLSEMIHRVKYMKVENDTIARIQLLGDLIRLKKSDFNFQIDCWLFQLNRTCSGILNDVGYRTKNIINPVLAYFGIELIKPCNFYSQWYYNDTTWRVYQKRFLSKEYSQNEVSVRLNLRSNIKMAYRSADRKFEQGNTGKCDYCSEPYQNLQKVGGYSVCLHCIKNFGYRNYLKCYCANYFCFNETIYIFNQSYVFLLAPNVYDLDTGKLVNSDYSTILANMIDPSYLSEDF